MGDIYWTYAVQFAANFRRVGVKMSFPGVSLQEGVVASAILLFKLSVK